MKKGFSVEIVKGESTVTLSEFVKYLRGLTFEYAQLELANYLDGVDRKAKAWHQEKEAAKVGK